MGKLACGKTADAMDAIVADGDEIIVEYEGSPAVDEGLISSAQAAEHCEITRYGTFKRQATELGMTEASSLSASR